MLRSAGCVYVQSAAQLRHVPRHQHAQDVLGEQLPVLCPPDLQSRPLSRTLLARWSRFAAHRPASQPAQSPHTLCALLATLGSQDAKKFSQQLRFDLSSVPNTGEMFHVCTPPRPAPQSVQPRALSLCTLLAPRGRAGAYPREAAPVHAACAHVVSMPSFFESAGGPGWSAHLRIATDRTCRSLPCVYRHAGGRA